MFRWGFDDPRVGVHIARGQDHVRYFGSPVFGSEKMITGKTVQVTTFEVALLLQMEEIPCLVAHHHVHSTGPDVDVRYLEGEHVLDGSRLQAQNIEGLAHQCICKPFDDEVVVVEIVLAVLAFHFSLNTGQDAHTDRVKILSRPSRPS